MEHPIICFLIDDDTDDHEIFLMALHDVDETIRCVFATDGVSAFEKLNTDESFVPNYIFIDMNMPRINGAQCLKLIKSIDRLKQVPVFMYSTSADPAAIAENKSLGATDFIAKPSSVSKLTEVLSRILQQQ